MSDENLDNIENPEAAADAGGDDWAEALSDQGKKNDAPKAEAATFNNLGDSPVTSGETSNLDFILDIPLEVTVELGRTKILINNLLQLTQGAVVELEKTAGEPVEIMVNDKLLGKGEVIVVNDRFGIRITEIISQADRIKNMK